MDLIGISDLIYLLPLLYKYPSAFIFPLARSSLYFPPLGFLSLLIAISPHLLGKVLEEMKLFGGSASFPALRARAPHEHTGTRQILGDTPILAPPHAKKICADAINYHVNDSAQSLSPSLPLWEAGTPQLHL